MEENGNPNVSVNFKRTIPHHFAADVSGLPEDTSLDKLLEFLMIIQPGTTIVLLISWNGMLDHILRFVTSAPQSFRIIQKEPHNGKVALTLERIEE